MFTRIPSLVAALALSLLTSAASAAVLIEDGSSKGKGTSRASAPKTAADGLSLRKIRRVAIGGSVAGPLGLAGVNLDLCFSPEASLFAGYGGGPGYQSFQFGLRRILGGENVMPFAGAGFARWSNSGTGSSMSETVPSFLGESFMTDDQKRTGLVSANLVYGSLGLQWLAPSGPWVGSSVYLEALLLVEATRLRAAPTAALGYLYYF